MSLKGRQWGGRHGRLIACVAVLALGGCSALSDFGIHGFSDATPDAGADSGSAGAGGGTDAGGAGAGGVDAGSNGGGADAGGTGAGRCGTSADCDGGEVCVGGECRPARPAGLWVTSGGGSTKSEHFRLRVAIGAPLPAGVGASENFKVILGAPGSR